MSEASGFPKREGTGETHRKVGEIAPTPELHNSVMTTPQSAQISTTHVQAADSFTGHELHRVDQQGVHRVVLLHSPNLMPCGAKYLI